MSDSDSDVDMSAPQEAGLEKLSPAHHLFLQALLSRRVTTEETAVKIHKKCSQYNRNDFASWIAAINGHLEKLGFSLLRGDDQSSGSSKPVLVFGNIRDDDLAKHATDLSPQEVAYFRELIREIMEAPNMAFSIKFNDAVSLGRELKPAVSKTTAQTLLNTFVSKGFLHKSRDSNFSLGIRALRELEPYLASEFEEIVQESTCASCDLLVTVGVACKTSGCACKMHTGCFKRHRRTSARCPTCKKDWPAEAKELPGIGESRLSGREKSRTGKGAAPRESGIGASGFQPADEDEEEEHEEDTAPARAASKGRAATKKGGKRAAASQGQGDDEEDELEATPAPPTRRRR